MERQRTEERAERAVATYNATVARLFLLIHVARCRGYVDELATECNLGSDAGNLWNVERERHFLSSATPPDTFSIDLWDVPLERLKLEPSAHTSRTNSGLLTFHCLSRKSRLTTVLTYDARLCDRLIAIRQEDQMMNFLGHACTECWPLRPLVRQMWPVVGRMLYMQCDGSI